jgi:hypothetical protein
VGAWAIDTPTQYTGYEFETDGRCKLVGVEKTAGVGVGGWCSYTYDPASGTISITELWDNSGKRFKPDPRPTLNYDQTNDVVTYFWDGKTVALHRVTAIREH